MAQASPAIMQVLSPYEEHTTLTYTQIKEYVTIFTLVQKLNDK